MLVEQDARKRLQQLQAQGYDEDADQNEEQHYGEDVDEEP